MGLELVIFIAAILFGIFLYWRESNGNGVYRFFNKILNSKEIIKVIDPKDSSEVGSINPSKVIKVLFGG